MRTETARQGWWIAALLAALFSASLAVACSGDYENKEDPFPSVSDDDLSDDDLHDDDTDDDVDDDLDDDTDDDVTDILPEDNVFFVLFFDVGLGNAALVGIPDGDATRYVLVDGGTYGNGSGLICPVLAAHGIDILDLMVATHADFDHCGGLSEVFDCVTVNQVWENGEPNTDDEGWNLYVAARDDWGGTVQIPTLGTQVNLGEAAVKILNTNAGREGYNDDSIVLRFEHDDFPFIIGADAQAAAQNAMLAQFPADLAVPVLGVPDHAGPDYSQDFVDAVAPTLQVGVISVGPSPEDYPNAATLAAYEATDAQVLLTQDVGHVLVTGGVSGPVVQTFTEP